MVVSFDTLEYAQKLEHAGMNRNLADSYSRNLFNILNKFFNKNLDAHNTDLVIDLLDYVNELISNGELPKVAITHVKTIGKYLTHSN